MSVKVEANVTSCVSTIECGDLFRDIDGDILQVRTSPDGRVSLCRVNGRNWSGSAHQTVASALSSDSAKGLIAFKRGESVTITQE